MAAWLSTAHHRTETSALVACIMLGAVRAATGTCCLPSIRHAHGQRSRLPWPKGRRSQRCRAAALSWLSHPCILNAFLACFCSSAQRLAPHVHCYSPRIHATTLSYRPRTAGTMANHLLAGGVTARCTAPYAMCPMTSCFGATRDESVPREQHLFQPWRSAAAGLHTASGELLGACWGLGTA